MELNFLTVLYEQALRMYYEFLKDPNRPLAVACIDASGSLDHTKKQVEHAIDSILELARKKQIFRQV
jgi:uncharacterized protein with von Willebrand factor type A (vWA) domain